MKIPQRSGRDSSLLQAIGSFSIGLSGTTTGSRFGASIIHGNSQIRQLKPKTTNMERQPVASNISEATITTRGLIGMEIDVVNATSGRGVLSHLFKEYGPYAGEVLTRITGTLIATEAGETTSYALVMVQERGKLFVSPGEQVYEGMIVGENPRNEDIACNAVREKKLTNFRSQGEGVAAGLTPAIKLSLERAIEYIASDEFVEVTPKSVRLRKR